MDMKKLIVIFYLFLVSCQNPSDFKKKSSENLNDMNVTIDGKIKSK